MKNHITIVSRSTFINLVKQGLIPEGTAIISIHEPKNKLMLGGYSEAWPKILESSDTVLNLWFNDLEEPIPEIESVVFDDEMADRVVEFVEQNKDAKQWLLHCTAGISRSGAVGSYLADYFGIDYLEFKRTNPRIHPNSLVRKILTNKLQKNLED